MATATLDTPVGRLGLVEEGGAIVRLQWDAEGEGMESDLLTEGIAQLEAYFAGRLKIFDLPLAPAGSAFEQQVLDAMRRIPFGETRSYGDIARDLGVPPQPVGQACGANPIPVIIPCHRVVATSGLGGFSGRGGIETKVRLLKLEGAYSLLL